MTEDMQDQAQQMPSPDDYSIGQELDWGAEPIPVVLFVELPFWLMVDNSALETDVRGHTFRVEIASNFYSLHAGEMRDSHATCVYIGPDPSHLNPEIRREIEEQQLPVIARKCKTVLRIHSRCSADVLAAGSEEARATAAQLYLKALCEAHIEVLNNVLQHYRLATYDYFPYEVSPWDVPVWFVDTNADSVRVVLFDYATWDYKPRIGPISGPAETYRLIRPEELQAATATQPSAGELELLDALNFMERGDYSDAVRRITTAIEAMVEAVLRAELLDRYPQDEVERRLNASRNDFPGRLRQYHNLSGRTLSQQSQDDLETTRNLRHEIVHRGRRITLAERGRAQRSVDTGRWIFNWLEDDAAREAVRERRIGTRSLGRHFSLFDAEFTPDGVVVHDPGI